MTNKDIIRQLENLREFSKSFIDGSDGDYIYKADIEAITEAIKIIQETNTEGR